MALGALISINYRHQPTAGPLKNNNIFLRSYVKTVRSPKIITETELCQGQLCSKFSITNTEF